MEKTPRGTSVGVDDPYATVERCDHLTDDGRCRYAAEHGHHDPEFARERHEDDLRCPVVVPEGEASPASERASSAEQGSEDHSSGRSPREDGEQSDPRAGEWEWKDCPHFRARQRSRECVRCGLEERRVAHDDERPLLEEHHLTYAEGQAPDDVDAEGESGSDDDGDGTEQSHEITVYLCRWCHAKIHTSWARIDDDVGPDPEAIAEAEGRRSREHAEMGFQSAADRYPEVLEGSAEDAESAESADGE